MNGGATRVRNGIGTVRPFVYGGLDLLDFVKSVFDAAELERNALPAGFHVQARIGDSVVVLSAMEPPYAKATRASIYVYVDDVDEAYQRLWISRPNVDVGREQGECFVAGRLGGFAADRPRQNRGAQAEPGGSGEDRGAPVAQGDGNASSLTRSTVGVFGGADLALLDGTLRAGLAGGYTST